MFYRLALLLLGITVPFATIKAANTSGRARARLLIVAPEAWRPALDRFITHKQTTLTVDFLALEKVLRSSVGVDDPERLKRRLYSDWHDHGLNYVLLVGDVDVMPVRFMVLDRATSAAFDYAFYPSDLYYADLARRDRTFDDWNARKDSFHSGYFGEVRGEKNKQDPINYDEVDYLPEVAVGRWPVSSAEETRVVAEKTIAYEEVLRAKPREAINRAAFIAVGGWVDSRPLLDRLAGRVEPRWRVDKAYYFKPSQPSHQAMHREVSHLLNQGTDLVVHTGHGQSDAWEQCFSVRDLAQVHNQARLPVVISAGCSTAYFAPLPPYGAYVDVNGQAHKGTDAGEVFQAPPPPPAAYQSGRFNPTGLGEAFLKNGPGGAVAYIGCNTGSQPCGLTLVDGFVTALARSENPHLGDCWNSAIQFYFEQERLATLKPTADWYPPSIFFQGMKFMVFGDPSLELPGASARP